MNTVTLPPSPNWYLSSVLSCAQNGTVAWGARNSIVIAKPQADSKILQYSLISNAHPDKVTSLAFSPDYGTPDKNFIISGGDEHIVRIWNVDTTSAVSSQAYMDTNQKVISVDWSKSDRDLICFVSHDGLLMSWNVSYNVCQLYSLGKFSATCLACSPHKSNIVAMGTKNGLVYVVNLQGSGTINYKLRGHDVEITSLSWCPIDENIFDDSRSKDFLLASGAKDRSVFIWRAGGDGRFQFEISIPVAPMDSQQHRSKLSSSIGNWTAVCWAEPKLLLASSSWGELIYWDFTMGPKNKPNCKLAHTRHTRGLFCIANGPRKIPFEAENWREPTPTIVWTLAQDRQVVECSIAASECNIEYSVPTQGGYVYCIAACPLDTSRIAFGVGDNMLRLWNLSEPHVNSFDVTTQWQKIMGKIRSIAWHPEKENLIAFGTSEGRVGVCDTNNSTKPPILYRQYHRDIVYSLGWGPNPDDKNFVLYSCAVNELVYYPSEKPTKEAKPVITKDCTEFAWKPDYSCMAVGYEDGSISFFDRNLKDTGTPIFSLKKAVQCLTWHPESTATDLNLSPLRNYLAVAINSPTVTIFDLTDLMDSTGNSNLISDVQPEADSTTRQHKIVATLCGHVEKIVCLAWSTHFSGHLVTGSYDNTAQVWKVDTQELIATYVGHTAPVQSCMWSPLDPDYVITGSADFTVRVWKISEQKIVLPSSKRQTKRVRTKKSKAKKASTVISSECPKETDTANISSKESSTKEQIETIVIPQIPKEANGLMTKKDRSKKSSYLFSAYVKRMSDKSICLKSLKDLAAKVRHSQSDVTNGTNGKDNDRCDEKIQTIFGTSEDISMILDEENLSHVAQCNYNSTTEMSMWNNGLRKNLQEATREKRLNDFLVSLSASLSMKTWQETCEAYATQLLFESNPTKAVAYLLSIHKIHRAIEIFLDQKMYREAYVLARCKLDSEDPILANILRDWANNASRNGNFEEVAQCYVKLGDFGKAAKFLARRRDMKYLEFAAELAQLSAEPGLTESIADQAVTESLFVADISFAQTIIEKFPEIRHREIELVVFAEMEKALRNMNGFASILSWLERGNDYNLMMTLREKCSEYSSHYGRLAQTLSTAIPENVAMLWVTISRHIALSVIAATQEIQMKHLVSALGAISQYEIIYPKKESNNSECSLLIRVLAILDSESPLKEESLFASNNEPVYKSLQAFLCVGLLNLLGDGRTANCTNLKDVLGLLEKLMFATLDQQTVKFWTITNQVNKLETSLATILAKSQKTEDDGENKEETAMLLEQLDHIRSEKKRFVDERVWAPSPIVVYSKANDLINTLPDGDIKTSFAKIVSETWSKAVS